MKGHRKDVRRCAAIATALMCFTLLLAGGTAAAGTKDGIIRGHVTDTKNAALQGVVVVVRPGELTFVTDIKGFFVATGLDPGTYTVELVAIGFTTATQEVQVKGGMETNIEAKLQGATHITEAINVTATRIHGELDALNERATASDVVNVLPLELITSLPNRNVADAAGRLPSVSLERDQGEGKYVQLRGLEPRFTSLTVNGNTMPSATFNSRQAKLDSVPSDLVEQMDLHKTASAELDGDMIGGALDLLTKTPGEVPYVTARAMAGYNSIQDGRNTPYEASAMYSQRFAKDKALGLVLSGSYDHNDKGIWDQEPTAETVELPDGSKTNVFTTLYPRDYLFERTRWGLTGGLDYRLGPTGALNLRGFYSDFNNRSIKWETKISAGDFITPTLTEANGKYKTKSVDDGSDEPSWNLAFGGTHALGETAFLDYNLSYADAKDHSTNWKYESDGPKKIAFQVDNNQNYPTFTPLNITYNPLDPTRWTVNGHEYDDEITTARDEVARLNFGFPYESGTVKVGAKYRDEKKTSQFNDLWWDYTGDSDLLISQVLDSFTDPHYYYGHYEEGPNLSMDKANKSFNDHPGDWTEDPNWAHINNDANNFQAFEKISALYAMNTNTFGQLDIFEGVRVERTNATYSGFSMNQDADGNWISTVPVEGNTTYTNWLPSLGLRYAIGPHTNLRFVYAWGIARPDFQLLVPTYDISYNGNRPQITLGNPDLKPTKATSYDLLFEHFLGVGLVSGGVFYKDLTDPIYPGSGTVIEGGVYDGYLLVQPINGPKADLYGLEVAYAQHLTSLPGFLSGLGIDVNYTYTHSKATFDPSTGRSGSAPLQRTVPNLFNFSLTYDTGGFSIKAALQYTDASIYIYGYIDGAEGGLHGPLGDTYQYPHTQIDAQVSYAFKNGLEIILQGENLNNAMFGFYNGDPHWNIQQEYYDRTYMLGVKFTR